MTLEKEKAFERISKISEAKHKLSEITNILLDLANDESPASEEFDAYLLNSADSLTSLGNHLLDLEDSVEG